jgi:hypothetical protein
MAVGRFWRFLRPAATLASECLGNQLGHRLILNRAGPTATHPVVSDEAPAPFADRIEADIKARRHDGVAWFALARQHDLRSQRSAASSVRDRVIAKK